MSMMPDFPPTTVPILNIIAVIVRLAAVIIAAVQELRK